MESAWGVEHGHEVAKAWSRKAKENTAIGAGTAAAAGGAVLGREGLANSIAGGLTHGFGETYKKTGKTAARGARMLKVGGRQMAGAAALGAIGAGAAGVGLGSKIKNRKRSS